MSLISKSVNEAHFNLKPNWGICSLPNGYYTYTQIEKKIFYKKEDVNSIIKLIDSKKLSNINRKIK